MEKRLANKFNMFKVVRDFLKEKAGTLEAFPHFSEILEKFTSLLETIGQLDSKASAKTSGITQEKVVARERLEQLTLETVRILKAYATFAEDSPLLDNVDLTATQLKRASEQMLLRKVHRVIEKAEGVRSEAEPYGLTAERLEELKAAYKDFDQKQSTIRQAIVTRKNIGEQMDALIEEADDLLKDKIDIILELAQNTHPELYNQYLGAREIIDR